jgi:hypothetical protein
LNDVIGIIIVPDIAAHETIKQILVPPNEEIEGVPFSSLSLERKIEI